MSRRGLFALALLLSLIVHGTAAWMWSARSKSEGSGGQVDARAPIRIAVGSMRAAPPPAPQHQQPQAVERSERVPAEPPPSVQRPAAIRSPQVQAPLQSQPKTTRRVAHTAPQALAVSGSAPDTTQPEPVIDYDGLTESYRSRILARIEAFKRYPMAARRQRLEGRLEVDLDIACDGEVSSLQVEGASGVLRHAAARSVNNAAPFPAPPPTLGCPHRVRYAMSYRLH